MELFLLDRIFHTPLALEGDPVAVDTKLDVTLIDFPATRPSTPSSPGTRRDRLAETRYRRRHFRLGARAREGLIEQPVHTLLERNELTKRIPMGNGHNYAVVYFVIGVSTHRVRLPTGRMVTIALAVVKQKSLVALI